MAPDVPGAAAGPKDDDWLSMPEAELEAMHAEALALFRAPRFAAPTTRAAASLALLHQLMVARRVVRAVGLSNAAARASMRSDHVLGYLFGLASGGVDASRDPRSERSVASTLMLLHDLAYGRRAAERFTAELVAGGSKAVGKRFAEGMLAAAADLAALERWRRGIGGGLPGGLLDGLRWPGWQRDGSGELRH